MRYTIISDSGCDLRAKDFESDIVGFEVVPLTVNYGEQSFVDDENADLSILIQTKAVVKTACPSPDAFASAMRASDGDIICVTLSSKISGSNNSARLAAESVRAECPDKNIFVLDSLSACAGMSLVILRTKEILESADSEGFDSVCARLQQARDKVNIRFVLQDFGMLVRSGRMSKLAGIIASVLTVRPICGDNGEGEIKMYRKLIGSKKALHGLSVYVAENETDNDAPVIISHFDNEDDALFLQGLLQDNLGLTNVRILKMRGISAVYASRRGIALAY